ncbi:AraC family transcriptional regulator [Paenibacillus selenitireducens]|uniref:AraC family transcriptional regulator n=1 Tax=Paenibacillus selenitireducens TaxID=1324314 RepID=A0A1T2XKQ9_9BACL|nr:AraC family transcriptional regulator [Paenibacillus selenitireducens]OPA80444.1 AraC family transcriptional regulator [Paenibacillus selenitireducens]
MTTFPKYSYSVASNPVLQDQSDLHVLFSGESQTKPQHRLGPKVYDYYLLHHIISGKGTFTVEQQTYTLQAGDSFLISPEQIISYESDAHDPWHYRWVAFEGVSAAQIITEVGFIDRPPMAHMHDSNTILTYMQSIQQAFQSRKPSSHLQATGFLYVILAEHSEVLQQNNEVLDHDQQSQKAVKQMIRYLSTQYAQPISIEDMAENLGYNRAYLSRIFKQATQMSPVTFLLKLRIDKGRQLLRERTDLNVEQISASVGIQDALYFSRQFRRFYAMSPTEYRTSITQGKSPL